MLAIGKTAATSFALGAILVAALAATTTSVPAPQVLQAQTVTGGGSVFVHWGNKTAPPGTTLIYAGGVYCGELGKGGQIKPAVVKTDVSSGVNTSVNRLVPLRTTTNVPPNMPENRYIEGAVCWAPRATTTIWGTWTAPPGWSVLYTGWMMGGVTNDNSSSQRHWAMDPICLDEAISGPAPTGGVFSYVYPSSIQWNSGNDSHTTLEMLKCAVIMKD